MLVWQRLQLPLPLQLYTLPLSEACASCCLPQRLMHRGTNTLTLIECLP